ncbi:hypothetical protein GE09DRAFT_1126787 [Coniochaeta sp. 2T2.1]|nr:hypothetical protein GE09DRAFT_1126787 [Coniochaeta sp. 2T2.1]
MQSRPGTHRPIPILPILDLAMSEQSVRHFCEECAQSFARKEHLRRHQLKHSATRPYRCTHCSQSFSRSDILRRHELTHPSPEDGNDPVTSPGNAPRRRQRRALVACDRCARFKIRCNGQMPCSQCLQRSLVCTIDRPRPSRDREMGSAAVQSAASAPVVGQAVAPTESLSLLDRAVHPVPLGDPAIRSAYAGVVTNHPHQDMSDDVLPEISSTHAGDTVVSERMTTSSEKASVEVGSAQIEPYMLDSWDSTSGPTWDDFSAVFGADNSLVFEYPNFLWPLEELAPSRTPPNESVGGRVMENPQELIERSPEVAAAATRNTRSPYANYPFIYHFKPGRPIDLAVICEFLYPQPCWNRIKSLGSLLEPIHLPQWVISGAVRDGISARVYGMLSRRLEQFHARTIPQSFPPLETIQVCFQAYQRNFAALYPIIHPSTFLESSRTNRDSYNDTGILFTAIMTLGCLGLPVQESRPFSIELAYLVRITINESAERDESNLANKWVLSAWVLMTIFSAWSGVKRHSELAEAFHGVFSTVFLRRNFYNATVSPSTEETVPDSWIAWVEKERDNRLAQVYYILEQEISLFYSIPTTINFARIRCPMPTTDELFFAETEERWLAILGQWKQENILGRKLSPPSLSNFYLWFQRPDFHDLGYDTTPLQLRLLLCTISTQVLQFAQTNRFIPAGDRYVSAYIGKSNNVCSMLRREELEGMLGKWQVLASRTLTADVPSETRLWCKLTYHIIWLELLICYEDVQIIAGKEGYESGKSLLTHLQWWTQSSLARRATVHAGRILKIIRQSSRDLVRPLWWPLAVSRAALVLWCYTVGNSLAANKPVPLDGLLPNGTLLVPLYTSGDDDFARDVPELYRGEDMPCIPDVHGSLVPLCKVAAFFDVCIQHLDPGKSLNVPIRDSVYRFLEDVKKSGMPYLEMALSGIRED